MYPTIDISLPPKQEWELRVIIWRADGACGEFAFAIGSGLGTLESVWSATMFVLKYTDTEREKRRVSKAEAGSGS